MKASTKTRRSNKIANLELEEIIGLTTKNSNGLASNTTTSYCVYPAGCVAVVYDVVARKQSHLIVKHRAPKPLSCVTLSPDGRFVAAGESGTQPSVLVWDYLGRNCLAELKSHHYGVACVAFSPDGQLLASAGFPQDGSICLWQWRSKTLHTRIKACSPDSAILSISFSSNGKFIVTAGNKHFFRWNIGCSKQGHSKVKIVPLALHKKPITVNLDSRARLSFVSVIRIHDCVYAITNTGSLCLLQPDSSVVEVVNLMVEKAFALAASSKLIACACSGGMVKLFDVHNLTHAGNLYYSEPINCQDERNSETQSILTHPDALACQFSNLEKLVVIYSDHSLYVWDVDDIYKATRSCVLVSHADCILDIKALPCEHMHEPCTACVSRGCSGGVSFATCSADGLIRFWDLVYQPSQTDNATDMHSQSHILDVNSAGSTFLVSTGIFERDTIELGTHTQGFRSMAVSSYGKQLAVGDCQGSLYIYDLKTFEYLCLQDAHGAEILSLSFSVPGEHPKYQYFLASGGRDGMIHIFDANRNFNLVASINDHSAAVTSVKLSSNGSKIISCSADGSIILRDILVRGNTCHIMQCQHIMTSQGIIYDMAADPNMDIAVSVGKDKKIKTFNLSVGKILRTCKQSGDFGDPIKIKMDQSCSYLLCSYTKKSMCMYELSSGEIVAQAFGHGQLITGTIFLPDGKRIISVDGDGCIFVWKIPASLRSKMLQKNKETFGPVSPSKMAALSQLKFYEKEKQECVSDCSKRLIPGTESPIGQGLLNQEGKSHSDSNFRFSISKLPTWARSKITTLDDALQVDYVSSSSQIEQKVPCTSESSSDSEDDKDSAVTEKTHNFSISKGEQWHSVYTVCLDYLSTPDIWGSIDNKIPVRRFNPENPIMKMLNDGEEKQIPLVRGPAISHLDQLDDINVIHAGQHVVPNHTHTSTNACGMHEDYGGNYADHPSSNCEPIEKSEKQHLEMDGEDPCLVPCDDDIFNQHFGNLSSNFKLEGKRSSAKKCYSARFVVKRDRFRGLMKLSDELGFGAFDSVERTSSKVVPFNFEDNEGI